MADNLNNLGIGSPARVAFDLMHLIADAEGVTFTAGYKGCADRRWILQTYAQCYAVAEKGWSGDTAIKDRTL